MLKNLRTLSLLCGSIEKKEIRVVVDIIYFEVLKLSLDGAQSIQSNTAYFYYAARRSDDKRRANVYFKQVTNLNTVVSIFYSHYP